jgi:hypothetical protein
LQFASN